MDTTPEKNFLDDYVSKNVKSEDFLDPDESLNTILNKRWVDRWDAVAKGEVDATVNSEARKFNYL